MEASSPEVTSALSESLATLAELLGCTDRPGNGPAVVVPASDGAAGKFEAVRPPLAEKVDSNSVNDGALLKALEGNTRARLGLPPESYAVWLRELSTCKDLVELGIALAWGARHGLLASFSTGAGPTRARAPKRQGLFPLPVMWPEAPFPELAGLAPCEKRDLSVRCWIALGCAAMNSLYGLPNQGTCRSPGKVHVALLENLKVRIQRFLASGIGTGVIYGDVVLDLREKKVSYTGEEILRPHAITPGQIEKGLPPKGHGGSIPILPFLKGRTRFLMERPLESLLAVKDRGIAPVTSKVHIEKGQEQAVFDLLYDRGIISWERADSAFTDERGTYLSGMFGVIKPGKWTSDGRPVLRCIINLVPSNGLFDVIRGDIDCLPNATAWLPLYMEDGEEMAISQGDMASAFYLFFLPECWRPYMCLNYAVKGCDINVEGLEKGVLYRPSIRVLPMGWNSSVGIMQAISREILLARGLPPELELKKSSGIPHWFAQVASQSMVDKAWWQIYLDNFMSAEIFEDGEGDKSGELLKIAMEAWKNTGVLTAADKQVLASRNATELGVRMDGEHALIGGSPERLLKTVFATLHHLRNNTWSKKECQIVLGRWIFLLQFRRAAMGMLSKSWTILEKPWPMRPEVALVHQELMNLICVGPLLQTDLNCDYDEQVTCSDASESGGAGAVSTSLTWSGKSLVGAKIDLRLRPIPCDLLIVSIFNGISGAFRIYDILGLVPTGRIAIDINRFGNRVTRSTWPDTIELHDVETITLDEVRRWANMFPHVKELHLYAGFPCIHLSSVRSGRMNLEGGGSKLFWKLLEVLTWVQQVFSPFAKVKFVIENVASMDESARKTISDYLEVAPIKLDPCDILPYNRPRFAWSSEPLYEMEGLTLWTEKEYVRAYTSGAGVENHQWIRPGWHWDKTIGGAFPTFMKIIRRKQPPPEPAGISRCSAETLQRWREHEFRYPPYQYKEKFLLHHAALPSRLLDASERELLLGFGAGHTTSCMSASEVKKSYTDYEDVRCSLIGDSFCILSFAIIAGSLSANFSPRMTPSQIVRRMGLAPGATLHPSVEVPLTRKLAYGGDGDYPFSCKELSQYLGMTVNHTGADVRICSGQVMGTKSPAHGSARAWWWQWRNLFRVRWRLSSHINYLEMKMILLTILWKCRDVSKLNKRWLHLEDSLVCLYILSKGRTSSRLLQPICNKIGAVQLAMGAVLQHAHVTSLENPTDAASRQ